MILCCGEALIDMIEGVNGDGSPCFVPHAGGAVFNTAIALGRLGLETGMVSGISDDLFGRLLLERLRESGVATDRLILSNRPTTLAFVRLENGQARYTFYDENSAGRMIQPQDLPSLSKDVTALYFGGISLAVEPGAETYAALLEREGADRAIMLDPNIRAGFISDEERYRARLGRMLKAADILKVSDEDLDWIFPGEEPLEVKARGLRAGGPSLVIVTLGAAGATAFFGQDEAVHVAAQAVVVVDTVGAGDTFNAGVLASLERDGVLSKKALKVLSAATVEKALSFGARVAAVTVSRAGANPPWSREL